MPQLNRSSASDPISFQPPGLFIFTCDVEYMGNSFEQSTLAFLDILNQFGARGTFFVTGRILMNSLHLVRQIQAAGHEIASHGYSHPFWERDFRYLNSLSKADIEKEVMLSRAIFHDKGFNIRGYRAPAFKTNPAAFQAVKRHFRYDSSSLDFFIRIGRYTSLYRRFRDEEGFACIPVSNLGPLKIPFGSPYLMFLGSQIDKVIRYGLGKRPMAVYYCHCFEMAPIDRDVLSKLKRSRRIVYHNFCGTRRAKDYYRSLFETIADLGYRFVTCSDVCR